MENHSIWVLRRPAESRSFAIGRPAAAKDQGPGSRRITHEIKNRLMKIGIFYGSTTGATETVAADVAAALGVAETDVHNVGSTTADATAPYDVLLLGSSTWGCGDLQDDWYDFLDALKATDLSGKRVGLFGCGDSASYPDTFCGALGQIYDALQSTGCTFIGAFEPTDYDVTDSDVCRDGRFVGLAVDESAPELTESRLARWCELIRQEA